MQGLAFTTHDAKRLQTLIESVDTKIAFARLLRLVIKGDRLVWAGIQAGTAAGALSFDQDNRAIRTFCSERFDRKLPAGGLAQC
jgi:hypothetical protein